MAWKQKKIQRKQTNDSILAKVPANLPTLIHCEEIQNIAASNGFDWPEVEDVLDKVQEELNEVKEAWQSANQVNIQEEIGDLLLVTVNLARHLKVNPEIALKQATKKFSNRFNYVEQQVKKSTKNMQDFELCELNAYWDEAKKFFSKNCNI